MEKELPKNWVETSPKNISEIIRGVSYSKDDAFQEEFENSCLILRGGNVQDGNVVEGKDNVYVDCKYIKKEQLVRESDVLIVGSTGSKQLIGKAATIREDNELISFGAFLMILRAHKKMNGWYFSYYFQTDFYRESIRNLAGGVNINNIRKEYIENLVFPLPPLTEQNRIVAKLDSLFAQLESIKNSMAKIPVLLKNFRQQVLTQAVTGKLTEEWRVGKNLDYWKYELAKDCCEKVQSGGTPKGSKFENSGIPFLKVYNIVNNKINFEYNPQYVSVEIQNSQIKKSITYPGDIVMNIVGPPLNKIAIIPNDYPEWNLNQAITVFRVKEYLKNKFLYFFFCEGSSVKSLINETKGVVGQINISLSQCRDFSIPIPSFQEQQEIVSRVESLFAKADAIEEKYKSLKSKIETLPQTILHKAFKGELTEQLETDGDAGGVLAEIAALKNGEKPKKVVAKKYVQPDEEVLRIVAEPAATDYYTKVEKTPDWYNQRFELWVSQQGLAARGTLDKATLRELFDAMDDEDK